MCAESHPPVRMISFIPSAPLFHPQRRVEMCRAAVAGSSWLDVSDWEVSQESYTRTRPVLQRFRRDIDAAIDLAQGSREARAPIDILLVAGADLIESFATPGVWSTEDIREILTNFGVVCLGRTGKSLADITACIPPPSPGLSYRIYEGRLPPNDTSSTQLRKAIGEGYGRGEWAGAEAIAAPGVLDYVRANDLYRPVEGETGRT